MRTLITTLFLLTSFISCSSEIDTFDYDPAYKIEIDFKTGQVKEGGITLEHATPELESICLKAVKNETLPDGFKAEMLCFGGGENNLQFHYLKLETTCFLGYYLITTNSNVVLVHSVSTYNQNSCLKRWIISQDLGKS